MALRALLSVLFPGSTSHARTSLPVDAIAASGVGSDGGVEETFGRAAHQRNRLTSAPCKTKIDRSKFGRLSDLRDGGKSLVARLHSFIHSFVHSSAVNNPGGVF